MKLQDFLFDLPEEHIARFPADKRDESRLMAVDRATGAITHHRFRDLPELLAPNDFLVVNNSKVIPAKLFGTIGASHAEMLITAMNPTANEVEALTLPARKFKPGATFELGNGLSALVLEWLHRGKRRLRFNCPLEQVFSAGFAPLPPYIKRKKDDAEKHRLFDLERYQTVYSKEPGSIAAPTAGLHFTPEILTQIRMNHQILEVTLNVGEATFQKIESEDISRRRMGREYITITPETAAHILNLKQSGAALVAVGTTSVRSLETWALEKPHSPSFYSEIFISPGFNFKMTNRLITNFHLPGSSLFILTAAFGGLELMQKAYAAAIAGGYRFFSYGDAMFIK